MELNLTSKTQNEQIILDWLKDNVSEALAEKINSGKKTLEGCWKYIVGEAKKKAVKGCAAIQDREVFGWAIHYFEEESIPEHKSASSLSGTAISEKPSKAEKKPAQKLEKKSAQSEQLSFADLFG